ncbi:holo-ACP synthase [Litorilinea aerophila]|uniref:Holo-[acyl-carrier-protein] synthase n=1 Tax=Litorilinea aerophila TaxID=1204385 RepID=A0A540VJZ8_9CHLR|nr:holo-ACP synthase [Litorilinea aerophila]MCC9075530.1 holo-ACP synthase [Litorilinea aerophila]OUC06036.1 ACP synthase [Litorilinea aerophila]GIV76416.1 MAG: holo-[acyl-carrier-protein] synthase [Litorilinea sp.]
MLRTGVDMMEIERLRQAVDRHGARFLQRVFTPGELADCGPRMESLAGRFAAKEAVAKALGTGIWRAGIQWTDIEVRRDEATGAPQLLLHGAAARRAQELGLREWSLSLSHDRERVIALVVALG